MGQAVGGLTLQAPAEAAEPADSAASASKSAPTNTPAAPPHPRWEFWRSPQGQPVWARPLLLLVAALAALSYAWGMGNDTLETFYGAAVRSMSESWHNFFFGAFDPWGTVSVDKLPGAFWVQALSVRVFGFHTWSVALPQAIEGTLTVLVLYRAVRRVAGPLAGLAAATVLAVTPVTILLNRGNISDTLLVLLLVMAADAATAAVGSGRLIHLLAAGMWVGLAFQAKMLQAWLVLPALYLAYLLAAPQQPLSRRVGHIALSGLVALGVSVSYMLIVTAVPAQDRPYADGSCNNSAISQVFLYNGADRINGKTLDQPGCSPAPAAVSTTSGSEASTAPSASAAPHENTVAVPRGPGRFLNGAFGRDLDWMLIAAVVGFGAVLFARRKEPRTDGRRAAAVLWATWLFFTWCFFASSHFLNAYYLAALAPPIAALCGLGFELAWRTRAKTITRAVLGATVLASTAYALYLLPADVGVRPWVVATTVLLVLAALGVTAWSLLARTATPTPSSPRPSPALTSAAIGLSAAALLVGSAWAAATAVAAGLGPFDSPYQPASITAHDSAANARSAGVAASLQRAATKVPPGVSVITSETSAGSAFPIFSTGREFLPVGGFSGRVPSPTLAQFKDDVRTGKVVVVLAAVSPRTRNPDMLWVISHCQPLRYTGPDSSIAGRAMRFYRCAPHDAG
jgi:4-amino-4-deoxy-L-arabinose transferase-like glycosyltransferase